MSSGLEAIVARRAIAWQLTLPGDATTARETDAYGRPIRTVQERKLEFRGYAQPLGESRTGQHDSGHITRGDEVLWVPASGVEDPGVFQPGREIVDIAGTRWGIVAVDDFRGKVRARYSTDAPNSGFIRLQITRKALQ